MKKNLTYVLWSLAILLPASCFFTVIADLPHVAVVVLFGSIATLLQRKTLVLNDRSIIYTGVGILVAVTLLDLMFPFNRDRFGYVTMVFQPEYYTVGALYLALALTFFNSGRWMVGGAAAAVLFSLIASADVFNFNLPSQRLTMFTELINRHFYSFYIWGMLTLAVIVLLAIRQTGGRAGGHRVGVRRWKYLVQGLLLILLPTAVFFTYRLYRAYESELRQLENRLIRMGTRRMHGRGGLAVFNQEVDLKRTLTPEVRTNQQQIVIRAIGRTAPGYLRGNVYDTYADGRWTTEGGDKTGTDLPSRGYDGMLTYKTFFFDEYRNNLKFSSLILPDSRLVSAVLLVPGGMRQMDIIAERVQMNPNTSLQSEDWQKDGGYTVHAERAIEDDASQQPPGEPPAAAVKVPPGLTAELDSVLKEIPGLSKAKTDVGRLTALLRFYSDHFKYDLEGRDPGNLDPVIFFLKNSRKGHCELYAASAALLLRRLGIPTRYVTGFICSEPHPSGRYFVARLGNAHAWLEAYDRDRKRWTVVEPTPPSSLPGGAEKWGWLEQWGDQAKQAWQQLLSELRRGRVAAAIAGVAVALFEFVFRLLWSPLGVIVALGLAGWYWRRHRKRLTSRRKLPQPDPQMLKLSKLYRKNTARWCKRAGLPDDAARTAAELAVLLEKSAIFTDVELGQIQRFLTAYQRLRFGGEPLTAEKLRILTTAH